MQIVIDMPDEYRNSFEENRCKENFDSLATNEFGYVLRKAFENGIQIQKGYEEMNKEERLKILLETGEFEFLKDIPADTMWEIVFAIKFIDGGIDID